LQQRMAAARIKIVSDATFIWVARLNLQGLQKEQQIPARAIN